MVIRMLTYYYIIKFDVHVHIYLSSFAVIQDLEMEQLGFSKMDFLPLLILLVLSKFITMASGEIFAMISLILESMVLLCCATSWDTQERPITHHQYYKSELLHAISMLINTFADVQYMHVHVRSSKVDIVVLTCM